MTSTDSETGTHTEAALFTKTDAEREEVFSSISKDINATIAAFLSIYVARNDVTILHHYLDKNMIDGGASFASGVVRLNFSFTTRKSEVKYRSSVLLKIPQMGPLYHHALKMLCYQKEMYMYKKVLPRMYALWPFEEPFPHLYLTTDSGILVLENLQESGFHVKEKGSLLDLIGAKVVLKSLAQFHALSTALLDEIWQDLDALTVTDFGNSDLAVEFFIQLSDKFRKYVLPFVSENTRKTFEDFIEDYRSVIEFGSSPNADGFNVILHGDAHCYNMLFQNDQQNQVTKCKLIDFQGSRRGSPVIDLIFFLASSVQFEVFRHHHESLFRYYLGEFESTIEKLELGSKKKYGFDELNADLKKYKSYFFYVLCFFPALRANQLRTDFRHEEDILDIVLKSEKYLTAFRGWVKYLELE